MKKVLIIGVVFACCFAAKAQNVLTRKEIYRASCKAVVQIQAGNSFGAGFITSSDGTIVTANQVVTTEDSKFRQYASSIKVTVEGHPVPYDATPVSAQVSEDQVNFDTAAIKIQAANLPHVTLGSWKTTDVGDQLTILPSWPGLGCLLLEGTIANKTSFMLGSKPADTIIFQSPIRNGFSGSPIFDSRGMVIAIEDTKVFGISQSLSALRDQWNASRAAGGRVAIFGIDIPTSKMSR